MIATLFAKILGTQNQRIINKMQPLVTAINQLEPTISALSDEALAAKTIEFKTRFAQGETLDELLFEAFAVVRETAKRTIGQRHFDVQLMGGIVLHRGQIAEMKTGEGKTLTATLPLYLNALSGHSAFLVTVNDYLARRDADWMAPIFNFLGLTIGIIQHGQSDKERKSIYNADIIYGTNSELGFDYLRDNMKFRLEDYVQRELFYAIVDEVDSILIDEARTPLIISGGSDEGSKLYQLANQSVTRLHAVTDYEVDEKQRTVLLTEEGNDKIEAFFKIENLYAIEHLNVVHHVNQALRAHTLFRKDVEYVVRDGEVLIVDEFTGRILSGRRYSDGLHQAIEAKEGVVIERESQTLASITLQNFFRLFKKLAGMTGTAMTESEEFHNIYKLDVISMPTNMPMIRLDKPDLIFLNERAKFKAIVADVKERLVKGQPVLIGTISIETSERLSKELQKEKIVHDVLNAKQHEREADIVASAGQPGRITIATNMAGRGTDIKLAPESLAAGGLYILGTERHESRRIDNQLRGRSGRQGDCGESRFYISIDDELIRVFGGEELQNRMRSLWSDEEEIIEDAWISKSIEYAQEKVEKHHFDSRKNVLEYDDVMNQHRKVIYQYRRNVLEGEEHIHELAKTIIEDGIANAFKQMTPDGRMNEDQRNVLFDFISKMCQIDKNIIQTHVGHITNYQELLHNIIELLYEQYSLYRGQQDEAQIAQAEKWLMLEVIDQAWKQHMLNLDHLKEGIFLRSWGQKNPLIEYKRESYKMFEEMMQQINWEIIHHMFRIDLQQFDAHKIEEKRDRELDSLSLLGGEEKTDNGPVRNSENRIGRNEQCSCGSGKKFKKCCG